MERIKGKKKSTFLLILIFSTVFDKLGSHRHGEGSNPGAFQIHKSA